MRIANSVADGVPVPHRTYIGQIERGEKNISFDNLSKVAGVLDVTGGVLEGRPKQKKKAGRTLMVDDARRKIEIRKMVKRLAIQRDAMDRTMRALEDLAEAGLSMPASIHRPSRRTRAAQK
ncbi:MAG: helix-turn-helix transcriptional regulator [Bryobacteraceae bacterium]